MRKNKNIWNYIDMFIQVSIILIIIVVAYMITESLERYVYRYAVFPFIAFISIFMLGILLGRGVERTSHNKPIGLISKKMNESKKRKNVFIFSNDGTYTPNKEIVDDLKSGEIVHIKQFVNEEYDLDDFDEVYKIHIEDIVDGEMENNKENE